VDNSKIGKSKSGREAERERGGGCIIGVLDNDIDSHSQIVTKDGSDSIQAMPLILDRIVYNKVF
jgi:hypothetical protein